MASASASLSSAGWNPRARTAAMTAALSALPLPAMKRLSGLGLLRIARQLAQQSRRRMHGHTRRRAVEHHGGAMGGLTPPSGIEPGGDVGNFPTSLRLLP
jgi:hypothetical protein